MHFVCCSPSGFEPDQKTVKMIEGSGISTYELSHNPTDAVEGADVIYTDVWASMGQKDDHISSRGAKVHGVGEAHGKYP